MSLTFKEVSRANGDRSHVWHGRGDPGSAWGVVDWSNAMAGEAGEVCNAVKKLRRIETSLVQKAGPQSREEAIEKIASEIGDTFLYLDLLAQHLGIDIGKAICDTFNRVSVREGFPDRIEYRE